MKMNRHTWLASIALAGLAAASAVGALPQGVRVLAIQPAQFEYSFTAIVTPSAEKPVLSFNDNRGRTHFVSVGESLGPYRVAALEPFTETVHNRSTNLTQERKSGRVTLEDPRGGKFVLEMGKPLNVAGWTVTLVSLESGSWQQVGERGDVRLDGEALAVVSVSANAVMVSAGGGPPEAVPGISQGEKDALAALWREKAREQQERVRLAQERREQDLKREREAAFDTTKLLPRTRTTVQVAPRGASVGFGTDYRYPTRFIVVPGAVDTSGRRLWDPIVVPAEFETRSTGISARYR